MRLSLHCSPAPHTVLPSLDLAVSMVPTLVCWHHWLSPYMSLGNLPCWCSWLGGFPPAFLIFIPSPSPHLGVHGCVGVQSPGASLTGFLHPSPPNVLRPGPSLTPELLFSSSLAGLCASGTLGLLPHCRGLQERSASAAV